MPGPPQPRSLPGRPSLRHLKLEAKRRLAAGEFSALHDAQVAIAREYGLPTWAALKERVCTGEDSHALDQLRWIIARFQGADQPGWPTPDDDELSQHFDEHFLAALPPAALIKTIGNMAADLHGDPVILGQTPVQAHIQLQGMQYSAVTEPDPPHRLIGLRGFPVGSRVHDPRIAEPPVRTQGDVPAQVATNRYLTSIRLADDTITVRELLSHTAGVDSPTEVNADQVPELPAFLGPVVHASGPRGTVQPSNGGIAVLGQLVADVTGMPYADAATRLVLEPLRLHDSSFPARAADISPDRDPRAVTGYRLTLEGRFETIPARVCALQAVGGLWSTGADLVRLGLGWSSLLPEALAHEALTPQSGPGPGGGRIGLGWIITPRGDVASHAGANVDATSTMTTRIRDQRTHIVLTTRLIPVNSIETRLLQAWTNP